MEPERKSEKSRTRAVSPARQAAFEVLRRVESEAAFASVLLASLTKLSREDQALAQEITLGVLRHQKTLDYFIEKYAKRPPEKLDAPVRIALRLGLYQLRFLTRVPPSAAVNESVNLVKLARKTSAAPMVNATLRNAARNPNDRGGEGIKDNLERVSVELSHPRWMLRRWVAEFGEDEAKKLAMANNQPPHAAFRVNTLRATIEGVVAVLEKERARAMPSELVSGAFVLEGSAALLAQFAEAGLIYIQDEASQLVSLLLDAKPGQRVLDMCAAPGSKTSHIAALTEDGAQIVACDLYPHRLATLAATCKRLGIGSVDALALDATCELPFVEGSRQFDRVLIDAPCTGTGTLRRNPEIKWRLAPGDIKRLADVQLALLARGAGALALGGRLVYSTCSLEREEDEDVVTRFLELNEDFQIIQPAAPITASADCVTAEGFVRTFPHRHHTDGFFAAVLERKS